MRDADHRHADLRVLAQQASGAVWAHAGTDLNATLLSWPAQHMIKHHVNDECEVVLIGVSGEGHVTVDEAQHRLVEGVAIVVPRGAPRTIHAGSTGMAYLSIHRAREPLGLRSYLPHPAR